MRIRDWQPTVIGLFSQLLLSSDPNVSEVARGLYEAIPDKGHLALLLTSPTAQVPEASRQACADLFQFADIHYTDKMIRALHPNAPPEFVGKVRAKFRQLWVVPKTRPTA